MDSRPRLFAKAATWQCAGLVSMSVIGFLFTGSIAAGGGIAVAGAMTGFVTYVVHEMLWAKIPWGRI